MQEAVLKKQDLKEIQRILKAGFDIDSPIGCGTFNAVDGAVSVQNVEMLKFLLKAGARPEGSAVLSAASCQNPEVSFSMTEALLKAGADPNYKEDYPNPDFHSPIPLSTPLHKACYQGHLEVVRLLLSQPGIQVNTLDIDGHTPLMWAAEMGHEEIIHLLLAKGADPSIRNSRGRTAEDIIHQPTTARMRALAERIAKGDQVAFEELRDTATELYRDIDYNKERERVVSNLMLMRAAFNVLGEQAARGNDKAFQALKTCLDTSNHLSSFAPGALGIAAAAGNTEALEILLHHDRWGIILSSTVFALQPAAENNNEMAVDFLIGVIENPSYRPLWAAASEGLLGASVNGNTKAKAALEKYEAANPK